MLHIPPPVITPSSIMCADDVNYRLRGYHLPPAGPFQPRFNPRKFGRLDDAAEKYAESAASSIATPDAGASELEDRGFAEKS